MDIDVILDPEYTPAEIREIAVRAEQIGLRAVWSSNYHQYWDSFLSLAPAALATSRILLGPLAVSPWEMHPLKMANALLTLNEISNGRAMIAVSGGGGVLAAIGWKAGKDVAAWPRMHPVHKIRYPGRRVRAVRDCLETLALARSGKPSFGYKGEVFEINRPFQMKWAGSPGPLLYGACIGEQMIAMGGQVADGIQFSDFTVDMLPAAMARVRAALAGRAQPGGGFRVGNFWAWHIKRDRATAMWEARKELIWRGSLIGRKEDELAQFCHGPEELRLVMDNWENFRKAFWTRSGRIEGVPDDLVARLIAGMASAGDLGDLDRELERFRAFRAGGLTELSLRLHENPMEALDIIEQHVLPALR